MRKRFYSKHRLIRSAIPAPARGFEDEAVTGLDFAAIDGAEFDAGAIGANDALVSGGSRGAAFQAEWSGSAVLTNHRQRYGLEKP